MAPFDGSASAQSTALVECEILQIAAPHSEIQRRIRDELNFLRHIVRRWHRDQANADDLVQETILQALANAHLWQPGSNLRGWLVTIMRNRFFAAAARSKRSALALSMIAATSTIAANATEARLVLHDVERALQLLPGHQRKAIQLIGVEGKSYEQAAHLMGMSVAAVRCHLCRGRERLKAMVEGTASQPARCNRAQPPTSARAAAFTIAPALELV